MRFCLEPGCPELVDAGRCPTHERAHTAPRRARKATLYGAAYRRAKKAWAELVDTSGTTCARCDAVIAPGEAWDLGHQPDGTLHPEHPLCNRGDH